MKKKYSYKFLLYLNIIVIILVLLLTYIIYKNNTRVTITELPPLKYPRVCSTATIYDDNLVVIGGQNSEKDNVPYTGEVFNLKNNTHKLFKSNFNNCYGNYLFNIGEKLVNIQLIKFDKKSNYGLEIIDLNSNITKQLNNTLLPRVPQFPPIFHKTEHSYCGNKNVLYTIGGKIYNNNKPFRKIEYYDFNKNISGEIDKLYVSPNGISECYIVDKNKIYNIKNNKEEGTTADLNSLVDLYELEPFIMSFNFYAEHEQLVIIDKNNIQTPVQIYWYDEHDKQFLRKPFKLPKQLKEYKLKGAFKIDHFSIRLLFTKDKDTYVAEMNSSTDKIFVISHFKTQCNNPSFVYSVSPNDNKDNKIYAIGGVLNESNFECDRNNIIKTNEICNTIEEFSFRY